MSLARCLKPIAGKGKLYRFREGNEFAVILRNATVSEAEATANRFREAIENRSPGGDAKVTARIGVASSRQDGLSNAEKLLGAAEEALHVSKQSTKNCVTAWPVPDQLLAEVREQRNQAPGR
jgi:diguanylate cyclase (GGDEF)-like protein